MNSMHKLVRRHTHTVLHQASHQLQEWALEGEHPESGHLSPTETHAARDKAWPRTDAINISTPGPQSPNFAKRVSWPDAPSGPQAPLLREASGAFSQSLPGSSTDLRRLADETAEATAPLHHSLPGSSTNLQSTAKEAEAAIERPRSRAKRTGEAPSGAVFSNQGDRLLSVGARATLRVWDLTQPSEYLELHGMPETCVPVRCSFSPDDSMVLATPSLTDVLYVWKLDEGGEQMFLLQAPSRVLGECFSRDGARIAVTCADTVAVWSCHDLTAPPILLPRGH